MKKNKFFIVVSLVALLAVFSACDSSNDQSKTSSNEQEIDNGSESSNELSDSLDNEKDISEENEKQDQVTDQNANVEEKSTEDNSQTVELEKNETQENTQTDQTINIDENENNSSESKENIQITSGEEAIEFLKQHLEEGKDDQVSFGATETPDTDDYGSYYTVQLVDISTRVSGKTGNLGYYKVYQDGTYKDFYDDFK